MNQREQERVRSKIARMYQRFLKSQQSVKPKHTLWTELDEFDRGEQWKNASIPPWVPKPVTNYVRFVRTLKRANMASSIPKPNFYAEYPEDEQIVRRLQKAHDYVWQTKSVDRIVRRNVDRALLQGTSIAYVYVDDKIVGGRYFGEGNPDNQLYQGEICIKRIPNANFFPDPDAYCLEDCKFIETTEVVSLNDIKENPAFIKYCTDNGTLDLLKKLNSAQLENDDSADGTIYKRDVKPNDLGQFISGDEMVTLHAHWERYYKNGKYTVDVTYYLRNTDFYLLRLEDVKPNEYPFAVLYDEEEENDFWGTSTIMDIIENQKIVNKLQQAAAILGVLHQNPQKVVLRESGINAQELAKTGTLPGKVWTSNVPGDQAIQTIKPMDIPRGLFELDDRTQENIRSMVGVNEAYSGQSVGSLTTSSGVADLIERATIRDKDKMIQIDAFVERISHLIVLHILYKWNDERPITTIENNGKPVYDTYEPVNVLTAENLSYKVKSNVYARAPITQASRRQQADKLMQMQGQFNFDPPIITPEEWIRMQEFDDEADILDRMEQDRAAIEARQAQDLAGQITQIAQQMQQALAQGMSQEEAQAAAQQQAQQLIDEQNAKKAQNGMITPQAESQAPQGVTSQVAMANMANGGM